MKKQATLKVGDRVESLINGLSLRIGDRGTIERVGGPFSYEYGVVWDGTILRRGARPSEISLIIELAKDTK